MHQAQTCCVFAAGLLPACRAPRSKAAEAALVEEATSLRPGEAQLLLSLLRLLELAADDSGLRESAMEGLAGVLGAALAAHPVAFAARWVLGCARGRRTVACSTTWDLGNPLLSAANSSPLVAPVQACTSPCCCCRRCWGVQVVWW